MAKEQNRYVKNKNKKAQFSSNNELLGSDSKVKKYSFALKLANVSILSPSFLCPALKTPKDELRIIILTDKLFFNTHEKSDGKEESKSGPSMSGIVNRYLKISPWSEIDKGSHASNPIFPSNSEAVKNIEVHFLWKLNELDNDTISRKKPDLSENILYAQIHNSVSQMYRKENLIYGFEIIVRNLPNQYNSEGLYNISWVNYKQSNEENKNGDFFELQDNYINKFNKDYRVGYKSLSCDVSNNSFPVFSDSETVIESYHPLYISTKEQLDIGHLSDVHVSSRQHLFSKSKARLIDGKDESFLSEEIGQLVNTSYATLKDLMSQMGSDVDLLIFTGDLIDYNRNLNPNNSKISDGNIVKSSEIWKILNLDNLNNKELYPVGIDNLVMYELFKWYYSEFKKPIMLVSGNHEAYTLPYGISPRVKLSRSLKNTFFPGKHIYVCDPDGNITYDDEGFPVTKHVKLSEDEVIEKSTNEAAADLDEINKNQDPDIYFDRANEGIPADHNLTISEAILMYGPDYARVVMAAASDEGGERNFKPENLDWFYHIFTPLSSFVTFYNEQSFINLGWGDNEKFIGIKQGSWSLGGFLPRATESVSDEQLAILKNGLKEGKSCNILCSHFTYANYNTPHPISEPGEINYNDFISTLGNHDYGTFENNRYSVYKEIIDGNIHYTLSGHSHRSGLYQTTDSSNVFGRKKISIKANTVDDNNLFNPNKGCRMLVAACGGPIAVQNYQNELYNWGLDYPSGNFIKFSGNKEEEVGIKVPSIKQSKPRLSVALDYADLFLRDKNKKGYFSQFYSTKNNGPFNFTINKEANMSKIDIYNSGSLILYNINKPTYINGTISLVKEDADNGDIYSFTPDSKSLRKTMRKLVFRELVAYIKITLKPSMNLIYRNYNHDTEWIFQIELLKRKELLEKKLKDIPELDYHSEQKLMEIIEKTEGYEIIRHRKHGEIPNFRWYSDTFVNEYSDV